ncbi:MAG: class IV adenylate cyclase [Isosphaeraceae bacterium]|nr:class IV adenylate cyclase [Isosphaeraceae bacterium]
MPTNIEIKARVPDLGRLRAVVESLGDGPVEVLDQEDLFFATANGRLKLRILGAEHAELILYHRADSTGPKPSNYLIAPTSDPAALRAILTAVLEPIGVVQKRRWVYRVGQTRVHLDQVKGLGAFLELEVVLRPDQPERDGVAIAARLMEQLGIVNDQLVEGAYVDLLEGSSGSA